MSMCKKCFDTGSIRLENGTYITCQDCDGSCPDCDRLNAELAAARETIGLQAQSIAVLQRYKWNDEQMRILLEKNDNLNAELAKLRALLSSARLAMRICIPKPSCHSIDVIAQIDEAIGEAGVHCSAWRGEG